MANQLSSNHLHMRFSSNEISPVDIKISIWQNQTNETWAYLTRMRMLKIKVLAAVINPSLQIGFYASASALLQATDGQKEGSILFVRRLTFVHTMPFKRIRKAERETEREEIHPSRNLRLPFFSAPLTLFFYPLFSLLPICTHLMSGRDWWERERERERKNKMGESRETKSLTTGYIDARLLSLIFNPWNPQLIIAPSSSRDKIFYLWSATFFQLG